MSHLNIPQRFLTLDWEVLALVAYFGCGERQLEKSSLFPTHRYVAELKLFLQIPDDEEPGDGMASDLLDTARRFIGPRGHVTTAQMYNKTVITLEEFIVVAVSNPMGYVTSRARTLQKDLASLVDERSTFYDY